MGARIPANVPDGSLSTKLVSQEQWPFLLRDAHPGYISWEEYEANLRQLRENRASHGEDRRHGPPREGPALLARVSHLRTLWPADDSALSSGQGWQASLP